MATTAWINKAKATPKFSTRKVRRCERCGRPIFGGFAHIVLGCIRGFGPVLIKRYDGVWRVPNQMGRGGRDASGRRLTYITKERQEKR